MSATGRGTAREARDFYGTPRWCVKRLLEKLPPPGTAVNWLEPGAGSGNIIKAVAEFYGHGGWRPHWTAVELFETVPGTLAGLGAETIIEPFLGRDGMDMLGDRQWDFALGNPPYSYAMEFVEHSLRHAERVCFLLRIPFLASQKRSAFMRRHTPDVYVLPDRPSFTGGGTDATDYGWFLWDRTRPHRTPGKLIVLDDTSKEEKRRG